MSGTEKNYRDFLSAPSSALPRREQVTAGRLLLLRQPHGSKASSVLGMGPPNPILSQRVKRRL